MRRSGEFFHRIWILLLILSVVTGFPCVSGMADGTVLAFPQNMESIREEAFRGDSSIQKAVLPEGITTIEALAFAESSLQEINLPDSLTFIAEDAFLDCSLQNVTATNGSYAYNWARENGYITEFQALLIGEESFFRTDSDGIPYIETKIRNSNDTAKMAAMLGNVTGPDGTEFKITRKTNAGYDAIRSAIRTTFAGTIDQDVSLFFIASHGDSINDGELEMPFTGDPDDGDDIAAYLEKQYLSFETLASWLSEMVKGKVVVILESCGAGSSIYIEPESNGRKGARKAEEDRPEDFVKAAVKAFAGADPGIITVSEENTYQKSTGDMRQPKFYVLAAAAHHEMSWGQSNASEDPMNLFTRWLIQGIGEKGNSPADQDPQDDILTLNELHRYIQSVGDSFPIVSQGITYYQHVQAYPENSGQEIFILK